MKKDVNKKVAMKKLEACMDSTNTQALLFVKSADLLGFWQLFGTTDAEAALITETGSSFVITSSRKENIVKEKSWLENVMSYDSYHLTSDRKGEVETLIGVLKKVLKKEGLTGKNVGFDLSGNSHGFVNTLKNGITEVNFNDVSSSLGGILAIKTPEELVEIKKAAIIADKGMEAWLKKVDEGVTEKELFAATMNEIILSGGDFILEPAQVLSGEDYSLLRNNPTERRLKKGDLVLLDVSPVREGYFADICRTTVVAAEPNDKQKKMLNTVLRALDDALETVKPGVKANEVDKAARKTIEDEGFKGCFLHHTGHPVGGPWGPMMTPDSNVELLENMTLAAEPSIYVPGVGGVRIEDDFVVTSKGAERLTKSRRDVWSK